MKHNISRRLFIGLMTCICVFSSVMFLKDIYQSHKAKEEFRAIRSKLKESKIEEQVSTEVPDESSSVLHRYEELYKSNDEFVGWIEIKDTQINYPVMQSIEDEEYYLHRNLQKEYSPSGTPFLSANSKVQDSNNQIIVYGHNMKNGTMFSDLRLYREQEFWQDNKSISFDTLYNERKFEIFAAFEIDVEVGNGHFEFYKYPSFESDKNLQMFLEEVKKLSLYDTEVGVKFGETILTLVTCDEFDGSSRMVVMAVEK